MVVSSTRSAKNKGQAFQKDIVQIFRKKFMLDKGKDTCFEGDIQANPMGQSGRDVKLSPEAEQFIPFDIEAKRVERLDLWSSLEQAEANTGIGRIPLLVVKRNRGKVYAVIELKNLLYVME